MPSDINMVSIGGRLTADPRVNQKATVLRVAVNRWNAREKKEEAGFFDVVCFQELAGKASVLRKGQQVLVTGRLNQKEWTDKNGNKRNDIGIFAESVGLFLPDQHETQEEPPQEQETAPDW